MLLKTNLQGKQIAEKKLEIVILHLPVFATSVGERLQPIEFHQRLIQHSRNNCIRLQTRQKQQRACSESQPINPGNSSTVTTSQKVNYFHRVALIRVVSIPKGVIAQQAKIILVPFWPPQNSVTSKVARSDPSKR